MEIKSEDALLEMEITQMMKKMEPEEVLFFQGEIDNMIRMENAKSEKQNMISSKDCKDSNDKVCNGKITSLKKKNKSNSRKKKL